MSLDDALGPIETYLCPLCNDDVPHSHGSPEADAMRDELRAECLAALDDPRVDRGWFFISFSREATPTRRPRRRRKLHPPGSGVLHLGCCYIEAPIVPGAPAFAARKLGINPGGGARMIGPLPTKSFEENVALEDRNRLLTSKADYERLGMVMWDG